MTKNEFLQQLLPRITGLPATEQQRILDYYNELVLDGVENGRDEEAIVAGFGSVEDAACKIWEDYACLLYTSLQHLDPTQQAVRAGVQIGGA